MNVALKIAIGVAVATIVQLVLFPIALLFMTTLNSSAWVTADNRTMLLQVPTFMILSIIFTVLGGAIAVIASLYFSNKQ